MKPTLLYKYVNKIHGKENLIPKYTNLEAKAIFCFESEFGNCMDCSHATMTSTDNKLIQNYIYPCPDN